MPSSIKKYECELKLDTNGEGTFEAVFSTMNVIDKDEDITQNGAFGEQDVVISQWNHGSWQPGAGGLPIGVGKIFERGDEGIISGEFDMNDPDAVKTYKKFKYLKSKGRTVEFSYSLPEIDFEYQERDGRRVRILKRIKVNEVSPVLMGAGENTRLLDVKGSQGNTAEGQAPDAKYTDSMPIVEHIMAVQADVKRLVERIEKLGELREAENRHPSSETMKRVILLKSEMTELIRKLEDVQEKHDEAYKTHMAFLKLAI